MLKQKYTAVTQLHEINNKDIIEYFENASVYFAGYSARHFIYSRTKILKGIKLTIIAFKRNL